MLCASIVNFIHRPLHLPDYQLSTSYLSHVTCTLPSFHPSRLHLPGKSHSHKTTCHPTTSRRFTHISHSRRSAAALACINTSSSKQFSIRVESEAASVDDGHLSPLGRSRSTLLSPHSLYQSHRHQQCHQDVISTNSAKAQKQDAVRIHQPNAGHPTKRGQAEGGSGHEAARGSSDPRANPVICTDTRCRSKMLPCSARTSRQRESS